MQSPCSTVATYLKSLSAERRAVLTVVRDVIRKNLDHDYTEGMHYGMIAYVVPHRIFPAGYHCDPTKPLLFAALASQKNYMSLYLMSIYGSAKQREWFEQAWCATGKKLDMGKSCIRFKTLDALPLDVIGTAIRRVPAKKYIAGYLAALAGRTRTDTDKDSMAPKATKARGSFIEQSGSGKQRKKSRR